MNCKLSKLGDVGFVSLLSLHCIHLKFSVKTFWSLDNAGPTPWASRFPTRNHERHFELCHVNLLLPFKTGILDTSVLPRAGKTHRQGRNNALALFGKTNCERHVIPLCQNHGRSPTNWRQSQNSEEQRRIFSWK